MSSTQYTKIVFHLIYRIIVPTSATTLTRVAMTLDLVGGEGKGGVTVALGVVVSVSSNGSNFSKSPNSLIKVRMATETAGSIVFD